LDIKVYNKTDDFNFNVVRYVDAAGNVPRNLGLQVYYSQCIRMAQICSNKTALLAAISQLTKECLSKGYKNTELQDQFAGLRKYRVGDYRVIYAIIKESVLILRIQHRKDVYRN
jgi:addiction module RelE/StbE family toxin